MYEIFYKKLGYNFLVKIVFKKFYVSSLINFKEKMIPIFSFQKKLLKRKSVNKVTKLLLIRLIKILVSYWWVYPAWKLLVIVRCCIGHAYLVSYVYVNTSSNISISLRKLIIFSTSQYFPSSVFIIQILLQLSRR